MSRIQLGLGQQLSDWIRRFQQARSLGQKVSHLADLKAGDVRLYIPSITNRTTGKSMGEHTEITAKEWGIARDAQDRVALESHERATAAWAAGFFDDLVIPIGDLRRDTLPRKDSSLAKLAQLQPSFDRTSGRGSLTAGNSSPLTDGAAALWVASGAGLAKLPPAIPVAKLVDWEIAAVDFRTEGLLMAPAFAIPRLLARNGLVLRDIDIWEIHEAFAAQVLFHIKALGQGVSAEQGGCRRGSRPLPARARQPERRQRRAWPSVRSDRRANPEPGGQRDRGAAGRAPLHREHLHRWRTGDRRAAAIGALAPLRSVVRCRRRRYDRRDDAPLARAQPDQRPGHDSTRGGIRQHQRPSIVTNDPRAAFAAR
jgi:hypothetical protein